MLDTSELKEFADLNLMKMAEFSKKGRKHSGKWRNRWLQAISPFPSVFKRLVLQTRKNKGLFGKGLKIKLSDIPLPFPK